MIKRLFFQMAFFFGIILTASGQSVPEGAESQEVIRIAEAFRLHPYLSFNVQFAYSDSATWPVPSEQITGRYKMKEGLYWAELDSTEILQGYNYNIAVYHDLKFIMIAKPSPLNSVVLQVAVLDSVFEENFVDSMHVTEINDSTRKLDIEFKPESPYAYYEVVYDLRSYMIHSIKFHQRGLGEDYPNYGVIEVFFSNYSTAVISDDYFRESKFIFKDGSTFHPQTAYNTYEIMVNGEF